LLQLREGTVADAPASVREAAAHAGVFAGTFSGRLVFGPELVVRRCSQALTRGRG
jgi:hypothetical protein